MTFNAGIDAGILITLLGLLWKLSQMAGQVSMMWKVFAAEHGLDPVRGHKQAKP